MNASNKLLASTSNAIRTVAAARVRSVSIPSGVLARQPVEACQLVPVTGFEGDDRGGGFGHTGR